MYKKVYVEITNNCNLKCSFCIQNKRTSKFMSLEEFETILNKLEGITKYLYFHVLGEPLIHPLINDFINMAKEKGFFVNMTTNGYLIDKIKDNKNIRQLNLSLHSFSDIYKKSLEEYMNDIFEVTDKLKEYTYINYRLWVGENKDIIKILESKYNIEIKGSMKLENNVFIDIDEPFIWPDLENELDQDGKCFGLITHFGILSDGTIIPCCLDSKGDISLGNVFKDDLRKVLNSSRANDMRNNFKNGKRCEILCRHCGFKE